MTTIFIVCLAFMGCLSLINPIIGFVGLLSNFMFAYAIRYPALAPIPVIHVLFVCIIIGWFLHMAKTSDKYFKFPGTHDKILFGFFATIFAGLLLRSGLTILIEETKVFLPILMIFFFAGSRMVNSIANLKIVINSLLLIIVFLGIEGVFFPLTFIDLENVYEGAEIYEYVKSNPLGSGISFTRFVGIGRFDNPNEVALIMNIAMPFLLYRIVNAKNNAVRYTVIIPFIIISFLMVKTASRAGFLGYIAMILFYTFTTKEKRLKNLIWISIMLIFILPLLTTSFVDRISTISVSNRDESSEGRIVAWKEGIDVMKYRPFLGLGKNNWKDFHHLQPHNTMILVIAETGFIGFFFWGMLLLLAFKKLKIIDEMDLDETEHQRYVKGTAVSLKIALIGFLVTSFFGNQCYNPLLFLMMGLPHALEKVAINSSNGPYKLKTL